MSEPHLDGIYGITANPLRQVFMMGAVWRLSTESPDAGIDILEVGSWGGASALTWGDALEIHNAGRGSLTCVDAWEPYYDPNHIPDALSGSINAALEGDEPYEAFRHNISLLPPTIGLTVHRGWSNDVLPTLEAGAYQIVYIDGDHCYAGVSADIEHCRPLVAEGGIICGDDLEVQNHQIDASFAAEHPRLDRCVDPDTGTSFHPGVTLAVAEQFGPVSSWYGFWAMRKIGRDWRKVSLEGMPARIPKHISPENLIGLKALLMEHGLF